MQEVPVNIPVADEQSQPPAQPSSVSEPIPPTSVPILIPQASRSFVNDDSLPGMQRKLSTLKSVQQESWVLAEGHQKPYQVHPSLH